MRVVAVEPIWILEDDPDLCVVMKYSAEFQGLAVVEIETLQGAWRVYQKALDSNRAPLAIFSEFHIAGQSAERFLVRCRLKFPSVPIFCISSKMDPALKAHLGCFGIAGYPKPASLGEIWGVLVKVLLNKIVER